ncbi:MAG: outer membrane protein assembly factor, partial [Bacteroidota bacterium]
MIGIVLPVVAGLLTLAVNGVGADNPMVKGVEIRGNHEIPTDDLLALITHTRIGEPLDYTSVAEDANALLNTGWFQLVEWDQNTFYENGIVIFEVEEYPKISEIRISGLTVLAPEKVAGYLRARVGRVYNRKEMVEDLSTLAQKVYDKEGIALWRIEDLLDEETGVFTLTLGEMRVGQITIQGNEKTRDYVIRRESVLQPGDVFTRGKLLESLRRITMLGHFEDYPEVELSPIQPEGQEEFVMDITIRVKERKTGLASVGAGYSSSSGFMSFVEVGDTNFLGRGETVKLRLEAGSKETTYDAEFYEPYLGGTRTSFALRLYNTRTSRSTEGGQQYDQRRRGGSVTLGRPIGDYTELTAGIKIENVLNEGTGAPTGGRSHSLQLGLNTNTTDHPFVPTTGYRNSLSIQFAGGLLRGDAQFTKYEDQFAYYRKVGASGQVLALRLAAGASTGNVPDQEKFLVGGADT